ncbi:MAG: bifunctional folylpolyglutamate synthase/dihydrofolate synthase [Kiloniellaceae bacterium]
MAIPNTAASPPRPPAPPKSDAVLDRLTRLHPKIIDLSLVRVHRLLARLEHPEARLAPVVHVAGTNGKGSVIAFLRAMLEAVGAPVQAYTSPHLVRFHERIRLAGGPIDEAALIELLETCEANSGPEPITFFEITTAAAFLAFAREAADALLLETGLGGRLDATNVVARPRLTVITPVSIDHVQYLGADLRRIAFEKAGILKPGVPAVIGPQPPVALEVIERRAAEAGAPLYRIGKDWRVRAEGGGLLFEGRQGKRSYPAPVLRGPFQIENAGVALACAELLEDFGLDEAARAAGLVRADWPGRLQPLSGGRLSGLLPDGWELWLDGGHNEAAGRALAEVARGWRDRPLHLVYGMLNTKSARDFVRPLAPFTRSLHAVAIPGVEASLSAEEAAAHGAAVGLPARASAGLAEALRDIAREAPPGRVLICGSLYLAGRALAEERAPA